MVSPLTSILEEFLENATSIYSLLDNSDNYPEINILLRKQDALTAELQHNLEHSNPDQIREAAPIFKNALEKQNQIIATVNASLNDLKAKHTDAKSDMKAHKSYSPQKSADKSLYITKKLEG